MHLMVKHPSTCVSIDGPHASLTSSSGTNAHARTAYEKKGSK